MYHHTFRNTVVEGSWTLPLMAIITAILWIFSPGSATMLWGTIAITAVMTYMVVEWNNQCQLLRIRSRMNSATFLALVSAFPILHSCLWDMVPALCLLAAYFVLFKSYGLYEPQGYVFHSFLFLSIGSLIFPPVLLLAPFLLFSCNFQLRVLYLKSFVAGILGLLLPYWIAYPVTLLFPTCNFWQHWGESISWNLPDYQQVALSQWGAYGLLLLMAIVSMIHFSRTSYNDKIRTRQYFYTIFVLEFPIIFLAFWMPQHFTVCLSLLILNTTPFIAHYLALARSRSMNFWFLFWIILVVAIGTANYLNLWELIPSFPFALIC